MSSILILKNLVWKESIVQPIVQSIVQSRVESTVQTKAQSDPDLPQFPCWVWNTSTWVAYVFGTSIEEAESE